MVPSHPSASNVYAYYGADLADSAGRPTGAAHNAEFVQGFPTVRMMCHAMQNSTAPDISRKAEEAYRRACAIHESAVGRGFLADCIAVALCLCFSQHPQERIVS